MTGWHWREIDTPMAELPPKGVCLISPLHAGEDCRLRWRDEDGTEHDNMVMSKYHTCTECGRLHAND